MYEIGMWLIGLFNDVIDLLYKVEINQTTMTIGSVLFGLLFWKLIMSFISNITGVAMINMHTNANNEIKAKDNAMARSEKFFYNRKR